MIEQSRTLSSAAVSTKKRTPILCHNTAVALFCGFLVRLTNKRSFTCVVLAAVLNIVVHSVTKVTKETPRCKQSWLSLSRRESLMLDV